MTSAETVSGNPGVGGNFIDKMPTYFAAPNLFTFILHIYLRLGLTRELTFQKPSVFISATVR